MGFIRACGGVIFDKAEWVDVPHEHEQDAATNPYLEVRAGSVIVEAVEISEPDESSVTPKITKKGGKR